MKTKLEQALAYSGAGFAVFPLIENQERPQLLGCFKDASKDPEAIKRWWNKHTHTNIGLAMGKSSGLFVVDQDGKNGVDVIIDLKTGA